MSGANEGNPDSTDVHEQRIKELAALSPIEYDKSRQDAAKELGIRVSTLDSLIDAKRPGTSSQANDTDEMVVGVEPWGEVVDGIDLADRMAKVIKRHCVVPDATVNAAVLWILASYAINAFRIFPILGVTSPQPRCGKTTFMETTSVMCNRALLTSNLTSAVVFRVIEEYQPTLIIDEMDTFIEGNEELRGIINSGHNRRLAFVMRVEGDSGNRKPCKFSTWTPKMMGKIGQFPVTIADRMIAVYMQRKMASDVVKRLPTNIDERCLTIRRQCQRWIVDHQNRLSVSAPDTPSVNNDRAEDNWLPLLAVADLIGGEWPVKARTAMMQIENEGGNDESDDLAIMLLRDIQKLCKEHRWHTVIHSAKLVEQLNAQEERPWPTLRNDKGLSAHKLASMLKPFGLKTGSKRNPQTRENLKGYSVVTFNDVFDRYLSSNKPIQSVTPSQPSNDAGCSTTQSVTEDNAVTVLKQPEPTGYTGCDVVTVQSRVSEELEVKQACAGTQEVM